MYRRLHVKQPLFLSHFNGIEIFATDFLKISNFLKIRPVGADLLHADGQTDGREDMTKLTVAFRTFSKAPKTSMRCVNTLAGNSVYANVRRTDFFGFHTRNCQLTSTCICCILCVFVVSYVYLLYLMCICCILCVFVVSYEFLIYLMCICCIL